MDKKGLEMAISTLIILVLAIVLLIGLIVAVRTGFLNFKKGTEPLYQGTEASAVREACNLACLQNSRDFCCQNFSLSGQEVFCTDSKLGASCNIDCTSLTC